MSEGIALNLHVEIADTDADVIDRMTRGLCSELHEVGIEARPLAPALALGGKGDAVTLGVLALAVLPGLAPKVLEFLHGWLRRGSGRTLRLEVTKGDRSVKLELPVEAASLEAVMDHVERTLESPGRVKGRRG